MHLPCCLMDLSWSTTSRRRGGCRTGAAAITTASLGLESLGTGRPKLYTTVCLAQYELRVEQRTTIQMPKYAVLIDTGLRCTAQSFTCLHSPAPSDSNSRTGYCQPFHLFYLQRRLIEVQQQHRGLCNNTLGVSWTAYLLCESRTQGNSCPLLDNCTGYETSSRKRWVVTGSPERPRRGGQACGTACRSGC